MIPREPVRTCRQARARRAARVRPAARVRGEAGQAMVETAGATLVVALVIAAVVLVGLGGPIGRSLECNVAKIVGSHAGCASTPSNPYQITCETYSSTGDDSLSIKVAFVRVTDDETLVKTTYSDGTTSFLLTHTGTAQAEAAIGAELDAGPASFQAEASAAAGGGLAGSSEWDFSTAKQAAAFQSKVDSAGGWNQIAHDIVNGVLPPGISNGVGWLLNTVGIKDSGSLPTATSTFVAVEGVAGVKAGVNGQAGPVAAGIDAQLQAAGGARLTTSGPDKGQSQVFIDLSGNATGSLRESLFGDGPSSSAGGGAGADGDATAAVTLSPSGKPLSITVSASGDYTAGAAAASGADGEEAKEIAKDLEKVNGNAYSGSGQGISWTGTINLQQHPGDLQAVEDALGGNIQPIETEFNQDGTQQVQPYRLSTSGGTYGGEGSIGIGLGGEGGSHSTTQHYAPGLIKPPGMSWGATQCTH